MENTYPKGPAAVPANFTKPTKRYTLHAWLAMSGLLVFMLLYFGLSYWFASTSIKLIVNGFTGGNNPFFSVVVGILIGILALFMIKALFFFQKIGSVEDIEITEVQEPQLFSFIYKIADELGAPRPHRVFLSAQVNAGVFYDLSILNFIYPTKKNLEIGIGLVNALNLNEFKAVLAHEFGHFAQKSMAVGRWVYMARQIAVQIIARRDAFDGFLRGLSSIDIRLAWIGWLLSIMVWSIRALVDTAFSIVILAERALSREMEFQADLVAVSLTGSDAIVNALYRIEKADEAWDSTMQFTFGEIHQGKKVKDVFELQRYFLAKIGKILNKENYGSPPVISGKAESHRVFKKSLAHPPKMWATHPPSTEREENAKQTYIKSQGDERSSWVLFRNEQDTKWKITQHLLRNEKGEEEKPLSELSTEEAKLLIDKKYDKKFYDPHYYGFYLNRDLTRNTSNPEDLFSYPLIEASLQTHTLSVYTERLKYEKEKFESLEENLAHLNALHLNIWDAPGGVILHEGEKISRKRLPSLIKEVEAKVAAQRKVLYDEDRRIRTLHIKMAETRSVHWANYLKGLIRVLHYCEHNLANIFDAKGLLSNTFAVITADQNVTSSELQRLLKDANILYATLDDVFHHMETIRLDERLLQRLNITRYAELLEPFRLGQADESNINDWLNVVDGWINLTTNTLSKLHSAALEELVLSEDQIRESFLNTDVTLEMAPTPTVLPETYVRFPYGSERSLQRKLSLWERFYTADGIVPAMARLTVAASIIGVAILVGHSVGSSSLYVYNGLQVPVNVSVSGEAVLVRPNSFEELEIGTHEKLMLESKTEDGELIESFEVASSDIAAKQVYNIARAASMLEWDIHYSDSPAPPDLRPLGATRWFAVDADYFFEEPPESIQTKSASETRTVLTAYSLGNPGEVLVYAKNYEDTITIIKSHIQFDGYRSPFKVQWLQAAAYFPELKPMLQERIRKTPKDVLLWRSLQDMAGEKEKDSICADVSKRSLTDPENPDFYYLRIRCLEDGPEQDTLFVAGYTKWPENPWLAYNAARIYSRSGELKKAEKAYVVMASKEASMEDAVSIEAARLHRLTEGNSDFPIMTSYLKSVVNMEKGEGETEYEQIFGNLYSGSFDNALSNCKENEIMKNYVVRMISSSEGASREIIEKSLNFSPDDGINENTILPTMGLMAREKKGIVFYLPKLKLLYPEHYETLSGFIQTVMTGGSRDKAEGYLKDLGVKTKAQAYVFASVYLRSKCPQAWREYARNALFVDERPKI